MKEFRKKLLPDEYYLDENFLPLVDRISNTIVCSINYQYIKDDDLKNIIFDVLNCIRPKARIDIDGQVLLY